MSIAHDFEEHRRMLEGLAYRMTGELAEAQDIVQETWLRWHRAESDTIREPRSWLTAVCTRLAIDRSKSARVRRETYVGEWLPEPLVEEPGPDDRLQIEDSVSIALMLALEKLSPAERAAFILHETFGYRMDEVAAILDKSEEACRKLASRARTALRVEKPRFHARPEEHRRLLAGFLAAARSGAVEALEALLAESVELHSDGGGRVTTAPGILKGPAEVAAFLAGVWARARAEGLEFEVEERWFNGGPGAVVFAGGQPVAALRLEVEPGAIHRIYALRNPDKLVSFHRD
ncbi:RNA polymerase sigma-70 factor, ECF subfamily [Terrimicrobium sacchariphilum]|jgi:RNA polymerase sigma-70 factor (ECF subfamily)|uniref:RNA polymerase sigma-70 factor, ECF subfamily n=1 Tax=Terrimicrobium sacchariphilum TaxID=690879 RepID=A0A146G1F0_TERSA|nr:RNA polymerase sigma factor SigJ [Terrimicrobium sacchariphilum]GAT31679.1 RNA polymerase sigma-70 factor, ECF subfamily [Terrimicrobium sacchariphilum]